MSSVKVETLRETLQGLLAVEDEVVAMISGGLTDFQRDQVRKEVVDELRGLANRLESE